MAKMKVRMSKSKIAQLPDTKPGVYTILNNNGTKLFAGIAKRGQLQETMGSHFYGGDNFISGAWINFEQFNNLTEANDRLKSILENDKPKYN